MNATITEIEVEKTVTVVEKEELISLTMTKAEAETLLAVTAFVGGDTTRSPRKHTDDLSHALAGALGLGGFAAYVKTNAYKLAHRTGGIRFDDFEVKA